VQITVPTGLFNLGSFTLPQAPVAPVAAPSAVDARMAEIRAEVERKRQEEEAAKVAPKGANISEYYDVLRTGENGEQFVDVLQSSLADQGYLTSGFDLAEAGAYAPVADDVFIVPGGLSKEGVGEFTFDKTLEDFEGYDFDYGDISNEKLKDFQEELLPVMAPALAEEQLLGKNYQNALIGAYENNPEVQEIYSKYGISPQRISKEWGSEYVYDPFTFGEIQTVDRSKGFMDYVGATVQAALPALATAGLGAAIAGPGATAFQTGVSKSAASAAIAGATGGDPLEAAIGTGIDSGLGLLRSQAPALVNDIEFAYNVARGEPGLALLNKGMNILVYNPVTKEDDIVPTTIGLEYTKNALNNVGLTEDKLAGYNINQSDLVPALVEVEKDLVQGESVEDSLRSGLIEYAQQGGGVPDFGINLGIALETPEFLSDIARAIREAGSAFDDAILQPPKEAIESLYEAVSVPDVDVDVDLPSVDIDLPEVDVDLPEVDVDFPDVRLPNIPLGIAVSQQQQPAKSITEDLFEDFLFEKKYEAPELIERRVPLQGYQAPLDIFRRTI